MKFCLLRFWAVSPTVLLLAALNASATVLYVDLNSPSPTPPYTNWATAATNIQDAIDAAADGDEILVTNGVYQTGGRVVYGSLTNRVAINKAVTVQSVGGPAVTIIRGNPVLGNNAVRCVYLTNEAVLIGFTLTNGATRSGGDLYFEQCGGGVWCNSSDVTVSNCVFVRNTAYGGGGAYQGTLNDCIFLGNSGSWGGAGFLSVFNNCLFANNTNAANESVFNRCLLFSNYHAVYYCNLTNCVLTRNIGWVSFDSTFNNCLIAANDGDAALGGTLINCTIVDNTNGIWDSVADNCIIYGNDTQGGANYTGAGELGVLVLNYCCTTPDPEGLNGSVGNITNTPVFVDPAISDFHLRSGSPGINAGTNIYVTGTIDLDGNPRIVDGTVDIGAYEFQHFPFITTQPQSQSAFGGQDVAFIVGATGDIPLSYQWRFNESNVPDATSATLSLTNVQPGQAGNYAVLVTNLHGSILSSNAALTVNLLPPCAPAPLGLVSWWTAEGSANDVMGVNNGALLNGTGFTNGMVGLSFNLGGANQCVYVPYSPTLVASNYSVEAWINPTQQVPDGQDWIFGETSGIAQLLVRTGTTGVKVAFQFKSGGTFYDVLSTNEIPIGQFSHVAGTWEGTALRIYINGVLSNERVPGTSPAASGCEFFIGGTYHPTSGSCQTVGQFFHGFIDELSYYNRALTQGEVQSIYNASFSGKCLPLPVIIVQPTNQTVAVGGTVGFSVAASGIAPLAFQWSFNGTNISGATNATLTLTNVQPNQAGNYAMVVTNVGGAVLSSNAALTVLVFLPEIALQPTNQAVFAGGAATFSVTATGTPPLDYQWYANGTNLPDATGAALTLTNVQFSQAGNYTVLVTNLYGSILSSNAVLTVNPPPPCASIINGLADWWAAEGDANDKAGNNNGALVGGVSFTNGMVGQAFSLNGTNGYVSIPDSPSLRAFTSNITVETWIKVDQFPSKDWTAIVTKGDTSWRLHRYSATSTVGLSINGLGDLAGSRSVDDGQWHHVAGVYDGTNLLLYVDGALDTSKSASGPIPQNNYPVCIGENAEKTGRIWNGLIDEVSIYNRALTPAEIQSIYDASITGKCPTPPTIVLPPTDQTTFQGGSTVLDVIASGTPPLYYQWCFNGTNIPAATNNALALTNVQPDQAGLYSVIVSNAYGAVTSSIAILTVGTISITQPQDQAVFVGASASFSVNVEGGLPLSCQWYFNGDALTDDGRVSGATTTNLLFSNVQTNDSGFYQIVVTNQNGAATSAVAQLTVKIQITSQPIAAAVPAGSNATFHVAAIGTLPLAYQWYFNGTPLLDTDRINGGATSSLSISNVQFSDAGGYQVVVTNLFNVVTSVTASLVILPGSAMAVHYVDLNCTNPVSPYLDWSTAATNIQDAIDVAVDGDYILAASGVYQSGGRVVYGSLTNRVVIDKAVTVQSAYGAIATIIQGNRTIGNSAIRCVYLTNYAALIGFTLTNGATRNSGDVFSERSGGGVWCESSNAIVLGCVIVTNQAFNYGGGVYSGTLSNCILLGNNCSSNGAGAYNSFLDNCTIISNSATAYGGGAFNSVLTNCTLTGNSARLGGGASQGALNNCILNANRASSGGGASASNTLNYCIVNSNTALVGGGGSLKCTLNNCLVMSNLVTSSSGYGGGGAYEGILINCVVAGNSANYLNGGGTYNSILNNCTIVSNAASYGGGTYLGTLRNCIVYYNKTGTYGNYAGGVMTNCCTTPLAAGANNFTNVPLFVDFNGRDFHLQSNSPCINSGDNANATNSVDFEGNSRIAGGTVDIGAYEYQNPSSILSYIWAQEYGLPIDGTADYADTDGDGLNNWQEWRTGTIPTNAASVLKVTSAIPAYSPPGLTISWQSVGGMIYLLQGSTNLIVQPAFFNIRSNIVGLPGTTSYTDTNATGFGPYFYRVGVQP